MAAAAATDMVVLQHGTVDNHACCKKGPGYASPIEAMSGPREALIYVTCIYTGMLLSQLGLAVCVLI